MFNILSVANCVKFSRLYYSIALSTTRELFNSKGVYVSVDNELHWRIVTCESNKSELIYLVKWYLFQFRPTAAKYEVEQMAW